MASKVIFNRGCYRDNIRSNSGMINLFEPLVLTWLSPLLNVLHILSACLLKSRVADLPQNSKLTYSGSCCVLVSSLPMQETIDFMPSLLETGVSFQSSE
jgi:hypothetical protein